MNGDFLSRTDFKSVDQVVTEFSNGAVTNRYYSMSEIAEKLYGVAFGTEEFWRVAVAIGDSLKSNGWKQVNYKNRRFWVLRIV